MSYTVVTMESGKKFGELHHRVPAILETDQDVEVRFLDTYLVYYILYDLRLT